MGVMSEQEQKELRPGDCGPALAVLVKTPCFHCGGHGFEPARGLRSCLPCGVV